MSMIEIAALLGRHAAGLFVALLLLLLAGTTGLWLLLERLRPCLPRFEQMRPAVYFGIWGGGGLALIAGAGAVFAEMAEAMDAKEEIGALDDAFTGALRESIGTGWLLFFKSLTHLADPMTLVALGVVITLLLLWRGHTMLAAGWSLALAGNGLLEQRIQLSQRSQFGRCRRLRHAGVRAAAHAAVALALRRPADAGSGVLHRQQPDLPSGALRERRDCRLRQRYRLGRRLHPRHGGTAPTKHAAMKASGGLTLDPPALPEV
jgi:hypothetical protein